MMVERWDLAHIDGRDDEYNGDGLVEISKIFATTQDDFRLCGSIN